jgi:hypothetical protein
LIISYEGQQYPFDMDDVDIQQGLAIEKYMGCSFDEWGKKLMAGNDLPARQALGWLILHGAGTGGKDLPALVKEIGDTNFKMAKLGQALNAAYEAEAAASGTGDAEAGPTAAAAESNGRASLAASSPVSSPPSSDVTSP